MEIWEVEEGEGEGKGLFAKTEALWCQGRRGVMESKTWRQNTRGREIGKEEEAADKSEKRDEETDLINVSWIDYLLVIHM